MLAPVSVKTKNRSACASDQPDNDCCFAFCSVLLACSRAGRMDDVAHAFVVADQLGLRVNAGALQVGV